MTKPTTLIGFAAALAVIGAVGYGYMSALDGKIRATMPDDGAMVAQGKTLYGRHCASCHGADLKGQPNWRQKNPDGTLPAPPHDVSGHTWHHPDALLFQITKDGGASIAPPGFKSAMPAFGKVLSDAEIWATLSYIKSRWPEDVQRRHSDLSRRSG